MGQRYVQSQDAFGVKGGNVGGEKSSPVSPMHHESFIAKLFHQSGYSMRNPDRRHTGFIDPRGTTKALQ